MEQSTLEVIGMIATFGLPLVGSLSYLRSQLSRLDQRIGELNSRITEHRENNDAHVTRSLIQELDSRLGGPTGREWGEHVNELKEVRHDLRNLRTIVNLMEDIEYEHR